MNGTDLCKISSIHKISPKTERMVWDPKLRDCGIRLLGIFEERGCIEGAEVVPAGTLSNKCRILR